MACGTLALGNFDFPRGKSDYGAFEATSSWPWHLPDLCRQLLKAWPDPGEHQTCTRQFNKSIGPIDCNHY